jgi:hypothetical protein
MEDAHHSTSFLHHPEVSLKMMPLREKQHQTRHHRLIWEIQI